MLAYSLLRALCIAGEHSQEQESVREAATENKKAAEKARQLQKEVTFISINAFYDFRTEIAHFVDF